MAIAEAATILAQHMLLFSSVLHIVVQHPALSEEKLSLRLTIASLLGGLLGSAGGYIRNSCHRTLGRFFTWEVAVRDSHRLIIHGPYSIVRHPSYAGWFLIVIGNLLSMLSGESLFVETGLAETVFGRVIAGCVTVYMGWTCMLALWRTTAEDAMLRKTFGKEWEAWAESTQYRLVPYVY